MGEGEQILRIEIGGRSQMRRDEAREEVLLETRIVGDDRATAQQLRDLTLHGRQVGGGVEVIVAKPGESLDRERQRNRIVGIDQALEGVHASDRRVEEHHAKLENRRALVADQAGRFEVYDRQRSRETREVRQSVEIDSQLAGVAPNEGQLRVLSRMTSGVPRPKPRSAVTR